MDLTRLGTMPEPFSLPAGYRRHDPSTEELRAAMSSLAGELDWARLPWPELLAGLVALGRTDIPLARLTEGHIDALRILAEAGAPPRTGSLYAVWASRSQRTGLSARRTGAGWELSGTLRFASGAGVVDRALIPVWPADDVHLLLDLDVSGWRADDSVWQTRAMQVSRSHTFTVVAEPVPLSGQVGPPGFYLGRPGFFPGGVGVAAVWAGGAARVFDLVGGQGSAGSSASRAMRTGGVRIELASAQGLLVAAGETLQRGQLPDARDVSTLARAGVAAAVQRGLVHLRLLAGAAGLAYQADLTRAADDLDLYVRQLNPDSDAEYLGASAG